VAENKFKSYLKRRQPFGGTLDRPFVVDMIGDSDLPDPETLEELKTYINQRSPDGTGALEAAEYIWGLYDEERGNA